MRLEKRMPRPIFGIVFDGTLVHLMEPHKTSLHNNVKLTVAILCEWIWYNRVHIYPLVAHAKIPLAIKFG